MSDEITNPTPPVDETVDQPAAEAPQGAPETDWKAEARKWETRAKADHELALKWREYEDTQKSEHEKLADELARTKAEASQATAELLRLKIASEKGISGEALDLLTGSTQEELEAKADKLLSLIADQSKPKTLSPDLNQGQPAPTNVGQIDEATLATMSPAEIMEAKKAGRLDSLLGKR